MTLKDLGKRITAESARAAEQLAALDDATVARLLRRSHRVIARRKRPLTSARNYYTREEDRLLGTMADGRLAALLGRTKNSVRNRRIRLRKLRCAAARGRSWNAEEDALLGLYADSEVARRLRRSYGSVQCRRLKLGIACHHPEFTPWTAEQDSWFGQFSPQQISRRTRRSVAAVRRQGRKVRPDLFAPPRPAAPKWTAEQVRSLGTMTDRQLASRLGRSHFGVVGKRQKLGIPVFADKHGRFEWTEEKDRMLRAHSDRFLVRLWRASALTLRRRRRALKIPPTKRDIPWTSQEDKLLPSADNEKIARVTGRTLAAIITRRRDLGILSRHIKKPNG